MNNKIILLDKPIGQTPLEAIEALRERTPDLNGVKLGYAGRLDPMAEGLLLVLAGTTTDQQESLSHLSKRYIVELIFGIETDSYDLLGAIQRVELEKCPILSDVQSAIKDIQGTFDQPYPPYSAVRVQGKPLFWWARQDRLNEISIPKKMRTITAISLLDYYQRDSTALLPEIAARISLVAGDFRQELTLDGWRQTLLTRRPLQMIRLDITCSSGTYMRSVVHTLGQDLGVGAVAFSIRRIAIGDYTLEHITST